MSSESVLLQTLKDLDDFGIHIDLLTIGGHGNQRSVNLGKHKNGTYNMSELDDKQLDIGDERDFAGLGQLQVLRGSDIYLDSCSVAKTWDANDNYAKMIARTIGIQSRVLASRTDISKQTIKFRSGSYAVGSGSYPLFITDNRPLQKEDELQTSATLERSTKDSDVKGVLLIGDIIGDTLDELTHKELLDYIIETYQPKISIEDGVMIETYPAQVIRRKRDGVEEISSPGLELLARYKATPRDSFKRRFSKSEWIKRHQSQRPETE